MVSNVFPNGKIESEDHDKKNFVENGKGLRHYNVDGFIAATIESL